MYAGPNYKFAHGEKQHIKNLYFVIQPEMTKTVESLNVNKKSCKNITTKSKTK